MYRYLTLIWDENNIQSNKIAAYIKYRIQESSAQWSTAFDQRGILVYHTGINKGRMQSHSLADNGGVVLGKLFTNSYTSVSDHIDTGTSKAILDTAGRHLIKNYWGRYVAFLYDQKSRTKSVVKGPMEGFRCYQAKYKGVDIYFSFLEDISNFEFLQFNINWRHIAINLVYFQVEKHDTAFHEMGNLQSGECRQHKGQTVTSTDFWNPALMYKQDVIEDTHEAIRLIRENVIACVSAWASCHDKIIHKLSGGLDSTIVLACLRESKEAKDITCLNLFPKSDKSGDERKYARLASNHYNVELIERELDATNVKLECLFDIAPLATPEWYLNAMDRCPHEAALAQNIGATSLFGGEGGDALFFQSPTHFPVSDYLKIRGLTSKLFQIAMQTAQRLRLSVWSVLYKAIKDQIINRSGDNLINWKPPEDDIINKTYRSSIDFADTLDPKIRSAHNLPYGKIIHMLITKFPHKYHHTQRPQDFLELCYPLLSQPLIEFFLKIPTYHLTYGGKDRGLTRLAFKNDLPNEILRRQSKGGIGVYLQEIFDANYSFIRDLMLNGILVQEGLINKQALERSLTGTVALVGTDAGSLLRYACTEIWLQKTLQNKFQIAA